MNTCPQDETLGAFVDGELAEPERAALHAHLRGCTACAAAAAALRDLDRAAAAAPAPAVSQAEWDAAWSVILRRVQPVRTHPRAAAWRRAALWLAAAAACLAIAAGALLLHQGNGTAPSGQLAAQCIAEEVEAGQGYAATVSYSQDGEATLITVSPASLEEAPRDAPSGNVL